MLVCIAGKNNIAVDVLYELLEYKKIDDTIELCVLLNRNDCGIDFWQKSLKLHAYRNSIPVVSLEKLYPVKELLFLSMEYDRIIKPEKFHTKKLVNIHFSKLPEFKGVYTSAMQILHGEEAGVTLHHMDNGIDTGDIIAQKSFSIYDLTCREVYGKCMEYGTNLVTKYLKRLIYHYDALDSIRQDADKSTYYSKSSIDYSNLSIDLNRTAYQIKKQILAYHYREYQLPTVEGNKIADIQITIEKSKEKAGTVLYQDEHIIRYATIDYDIILYIDRWGELLEACKEGNLSLVKKIACNTRYLYEYDTEGNSAMDIARKYNQSKVMEYIEEVKEYKN